MTADASLIAQYLGVFFTVWAVGHAYLVARRLLNESVSGLAD